MPRVGSVGAWLRVAARAWSHRAARSRLRHARCLRARVALRARAPLAQGHSAAMSSEAIDYVKKPTMEFINDSWRLVKRCTKPDRTGALQTRALSAVAPSTASCLLRCGML